MRKVILLAGLLAVLSTCVVGSAGVASNVRTFIDSTGETCCTADITRVVVANDDAGTITFRVVWDDPQRLSSTDDFIPINTERKPYRVETTDGGGYGLFLMTPDGATERARLATIYTHEEPDGFAFSVERHLIGDADRFSFDVELWSVSSFAAYLEAAPDRGEWTFPVKINLARIRPALTIRQSRVRERRTLVGMLALQVGRTHQLLASGTIACAASMRGRDLVVLERRFVHRRALCRWRLPRQLQAKTPISGRVAVRVTKAPNSVKAQAFRFVAR